MCFPHRALGAGIQKGIAELGSGYFNGIWLDWSISQINFPTGAHKIIMGTITANQVVLIRAALGLALVR